MPPGQAGLAAGSSSQERPPLSIVVNSLLFSDEGADDKGHIMVKTPWTRKVIEYIRWRMKVNTVSIPGTENGKAFTLMNRSSSQEHQHYKH